MESCDCRILGSSPDLLAINNFKWSDHNTFTDYHIYSLKLTMSQVSVVMVPGFWEASAVFSPVLEALKQDSNCRVSVATLESTGRSSPGNPTLEDDTAVIRAHIKNQIHDSNDVVLVLHSAGGYLGCNAIKDLTATERVKLGLKGGVKRIVFLCAGVFEKGTKTGPMPFFDKEGGQLHCKDARHTLFNDLPDEVAGKWLAQLQCQPAYGWDCEITHNGARDVPSTYLICDKDAAVPPDMQRQFADLAHSEVKHCHAGHMVIVSHPEVVVELVREAICSTIGN